MRKLLVLLFFISTQLPAQTHFITAGQTQGMIFTDYVPDKYLFNAYYSGTSSSLIDLNNDGHDDVLLFYNAFTAGGTNGHGGWSESSTNISSVDSNFQIICSYDSTSNGQPCQGYHYITKTFSLNDTIPNNYGLLYSNFSEIIYGYSQVGGGCTYGIPGSAYPGCYFFGRWVTNTDTLLFYIHFQVQPYGYCYCLDYAIEGPTSSYVIASTNDLTASNISVSPNPFTNQINISIDKPFAYQITDYIGRVVLQGKTENSINTGALAAGNYLLVIKNEETYSVKKIVKL